MRASGEELISPEAAVILISSVFEEPLICFSNSTTTYYES